jgi:hypothetical protein
VFDLLAERGISVDLSRQPVLPVARRFLARTDAFETPIDLAPDPNVFPIARVSHTNTLDLITNDFSPWLGARLGLSSVALEPVRVFLKELFRNIEDHADVETGYLAAQNSPGQGQVEIALGDSGIGIPGCVRRKIPGIGDGAALSRAFEEGSAQRVDLGTAALG